MISEFVETFNANKDKMRRVFRESFPSDYEGIVREVVKAVNGYGESGFREPDPDNIHVIDDGDYQGTLLFIIPERTYQPHEYWYVRVWYGSCSGCDALMSIEHRCGTEPTDQQLDDVMTLALHVVQGMRKMGGDAS